MSYVDDDRVSQSNPTSIPPPPYFLPSLLFLLPSAGRPLRIVRQRRRCRQWGPARSVGRSPAVTLATLPTESPAAAPDAELEKLYHHRVRRICTLNTLQHSLDV